jgi:hypothetical protein
MQQTTKPLVTQGRPPGTEVPPEPHCVAAAALVKAASPVEIGGPPGPEPTRYGDWERNGRCVDF